MYQDNWSTVEKKIAAAFCEAREMGEKVQTILEAVEELKVRVEDIRREMQAMKELIYWAVGLHFLWGLLLLMGVVVFR